MNEYIFAVLVLFVVLISYHLGFLDGKKDRKIDLQGLGAKEAFAYFLLREKHRHRSDIAQINMDLKKLDRQGIKAPDIPLNMWIEVRDK